MEPVSKNKMRNQKPVLRPSMKEKQDESIMGTNNSCIVSKRSVEKLYHKKDDGFLRYFVKKFQRRSPLINRGYWLRMRAIEHVVRCFLLEPGMGKKIVVNLGCGYDPLPFNFLASETALCKNATFIDVDYGLLMKKKVQIIRTTTQLSELIPDVESHPPSDELLLFSNQYVAVACDLENLDSLKSIFDEKLHIANHAVLFLAEVSITYMKADAAERLIAWSAQLPDARFCVLEQFLPDGPTHPFANTMLKHFQKLNSPLKSALRFPLLLDQRNRFFQTGWQNIDVRSLWDWWSDDKFLPVVERRALDQVEPFDEWEEFALFASHYFVLVARNVGGLRLETSSDTPASAIAAKWNAETDIQMELKFLPYASELGRRRYGAVFAVDRYMIAHHGGHGIRGRLKDSALYQLEDPENATPSLVPDMRAFENRSEIMAHTIAPVNDGKFLLVGGRTSPESGSSACLIKRHVGWQESAQLPYDLFRHCCVNIRCGPADLIGCGVLVFGGKSGSGELHDEWLYWTESHGWISIPLEDERPSARFGAAMAITNNYDNEGLMLGGIGENAKILSDIWKWKLNLSPTPTLDFKNITKYLSFQHGMRIDALSRFGASLAASPCGTYLVGGVAVGTLLRHDVEIVHITCDLKVSKVKMDSSIPRPLLIGCGVLHVNPVSIIIIGGGAVCFSFGTCWNEGCYTLKDSDYDPPLRPWSLLPMAEDANSDSTAKQNNAGRAVALSNGQNIGPETGRLIDVTSLNSSGGFEALVRATKPSILRGFNIGKCVSQWNSSYLKQQLGEERLVVIHAGSSPTMNFLTKDFSYKTVPFGEFMNLVEANEPVYLRALSSNRPADKATHLFEDFPSIATDFTIPPELSWIENRIHSMPLRISGPVTMWLHYDVMANVLCQIRGTKRLILFPPSDVKYLDLPAGASSSRFNIFDTTGNVTYPAGSHPVMFDMQPGDILFIPALWAHTAQPTGGMSVAVNIFFRDLDSGYAAGKDVYGNRDVQAYEQGRRDIQKISKAFAQLPKETGAFYLRRLAAELAEVADGWRS